MLHYTYMYTPGTMQVTLVQAEQLQRQVSSLQRQEAFFIVVGTHILW